MAVTKEYVDYLKKHVTWEVEEYEDNIFRGWTLSEASSLLGFERETIADDVFPEVESVTAPEPVNWAGHKCDHGVKNQGSCGSCWAFATTGMLSDRCCIMGKDNGWLSAQEMVSCDRANSGCRGGGIDTPLNYMSNGLATWTCFPYVGRVTSCPTKCADQSDFKAAHVCKCENPTRCTGVEGIKACLTAGPGVLGFFPTRSFLSYKSGIYHCESGSAIGGHAITAMGFGLTPECYFILRNSWGPSWGEKGYFKMACNTCNIQGGSVCANVSA